ncbi:hypothetical protein [Streptomyces mirabilis]|uniref:hypothetical protein n=1 Tax=Streptomyces mirabilis TaxID=68239 RepID=UPI002257A0B0|nr:hypothetical protein [Streptomyces mirabilis]MCX4608695.1 hypothetical protein [Streptomyces mirabilis]
MANGERFKITAFSNDFQFHTTGGVVYQAVDADQEHVDKLKALEAERNPSYWLKVEVQG